MWRTCKIVAYVHMWQCDLLPSSPSPISGISLHAISPQLPTPRCPSPIPPNRPQCVVLPFLCPCVLIVQHLPMGKTWGVSFSVLVSVCWEWCSPVHPCPYKRHKLIISDCCTIFHGVYVPHFPNPVYYQWAFGLIPGLCYYKQCCNEHSCACVLIVEWFIVLWIYTQ